MYSSKSHRTVLILSTALSIAWLYMGFVPKILFPETGELEMTRGLAVFDGIENTIVTLVGIGEIIFALIIFFFRKKEVHYINIAALVGLAIGAMLGKPEIYTFPFNPFALSVSMIGMSVVIILNLGSEISSPEL